MKRAVFVTGGTGFLGVALVRELVSSGRDVHVLARSSTDRSVLEGVPVTWHAGDLEDQIALERALTAAAKGEADLELVHNAAVISYRTDDRDLQWRVNVEGTRKVLAAAREAGVRRAVHVSSVVAIGHSRRGKILTEDAPWPGNPLGVDYIATKRAGEELALDAAQELELCVVNPAAVFGPVQRAANIVSFLSSIADRKIGPLAAPGGLSVVGLRDTARGIRLALERGTPGRRYLLAESTRTFAELSRMTAERLGVPPVRGSVPRALWPLVTGGARVIDGFHRLGVATPQALRILGHYFWFDAARARDELGWQPAPFEGVLDETITALVRAGRIRASNS